VRRLTGAGSLPTLPRMPETLPCAACGAQVDADEVAEGLAVRVSGKLLCPLCVDHLPGESKIAINRMRALRGLAATTYRFLSGRHPGLAMFTFTTAGQLLNHRRHMVAGKSFETPPLPPPASRPRLPSAAEAARGDRTGWIAVAGVGVLLASAIVWIAAPGSKPAPPAPTDTAPVQAAPQPAPEQPQQPTAAGPAIELTRLEQRLREAPADAAAIADAAERIRDGLPTTDSALRNRATALAEQAFAVQRSQITAQPPQPATPPQQPEAPRPPVAETPVPAPEPPPARPEPQTPVAPPTPPPQTAVQPPPVQKPVLPDALKPLDLPPAAKPEPKPRTRTAKPTPAAAWDGHLMWPERAIPLVAAEKPLVDDRRLTMTHWPWPSGVSVWVPAVPPRSKRLAIELRASLAGAAGGAALVVHPGRIDRTRLVATWSDSTARGEPVELELAGGLRWQTVVVPAASAEKLAAGDLRLRIEDARDDLAGERPFLLAGAGLRADRAPTADDAVPDLALPDPVAVEKLGSPLKLQRAIAGGPAGAALRRSRFDILQTRALLPEVSAARNDAFRNAFRDRLNAALPRQRELRAAPVDDIPQLSEVHLDPKRPWPASGPFAGLDQVHAVVIGWGGEAFDPRLDGPLGRLIQKLAQGRQGALPVVAVGALEELDDAEQAALSARWDPVIPTLLAAGIPVIDLRPAQRRATADAVREAAGRLLADGLVQLGWLLR
jgi:hypothetical protein